MRLHLLCPISRTERRNNRELLGASQEDHPLPAGAKCSAVFHRRALLCPVQPQGRRLSGFCAPNTCFLPHCLGQEGAGKGAGATSGAELRPIPGPDGGKQWFTVAHPATGIRQWWGRGVSHLSSSVPLVGNGTLFSTSPPSSQPRRVPKRRCPGHGLCFHRSLLSPTQPPASPSAPASSTPIAPPARVRAPSQCRGF